MQSMRRQAGMTLMELLVVMGIIAMIAGVSVGLIKKGDRGLTLEVNAKLIRSALRQARNSAIETGVGAIVRLDAENAVIESAVVENGGNWHFEDDTGSRGTTISGGQYADGGKLGRCVELSGGEVDLGAYPWYAAVNGFRIETWIKPAEIATGTIVSRESAFKLALTEEGGLVAEFKVGEQQGDGVRLETRDGLLQADRWYRVALGYDRIQGRIEVDGVVRAQRRESRPLTRDAVSKLVIGSSASGFKGLVDEMRYSVVMDAVAEALGVGADVDPEADNIIRFDGQGRLDPVFHIRPAELRLIGDAVEEDGERAVERIRVEMSGAIR